MINDTRSQDWVRKGGAILVWVVVLIWLLVACGNHPKTYTIGVVNFAPFLDDIVEGFKQGMTELGYIEGENITYIYEGATDNIAKLDPVAQGWWWQTLI